MRTPFITPDAHDRRAAAGCAAAGFGVMTLLALRADWVLARGVLEFRRSGQNVAAYVMGLDLLPWTSVFTAAVAAAGLIALSCACGGAPAPRPHAAGDQRAPFRPNTCRTRLAGR